VRLRLPLEGGAPRLPWQRLMRAALGLQDDAALAGLLRGCSVFVGSSAFFADEVMTPQGRLAGTTLNAAVFEALGQAPERALRDEGRPPRWPACCCGRWRRCRCCGAGAWWPGWRSR
jgi:hypothetical protein